ncbi:phosphotransferase [Picosynechococcus sp. NKBG15041c]|uniref:phosphotransferase n=1 Tax=Picosynechococcus sp. NKBG15041c TaxID=1407650 RepID=UPI000427684C|nr:phosphotransferase [Picosynechococcus sp. NKBG15041c]
MVCSNFPVIYSTLSAFALAKQVLPKYGLRGNVECELWNRGLSDIYLVQAGQDSFVLRVSHHHWRSATDIFFELEFLSFLKAKGLPVAAPLSTEAGKLAVKINAPEGDRYAALFPFAPGEIALGGWNETQSRRLGEVVAQIHQVGQEFACDHPRKPLDLNYLLDESLAVIFPFFGDRPHDWGFMKDTAQKIRETLAQLPREKPLWSVCWGDAHCGNVHFTEDYELTLFDFDQCGYGWRAFEIGKFFQGALTTGMRRKVREAFVAGYESQTAFLPQEQTALQALTQLAYIWSWRISLTSIQIFSNSQLDRHYLTKRIERLKALSSRDWQLF